jgi:DNA-binding MarR family transcriptional regulator
MSERALLSLLLRYPHPVAIARRVHGATLSEGVSRLERAGFVARRRGLYRVTDRGRAALQLDRALRLAVGRALGA